VLELLGAGDLDLRARIPALVGISTPGNTDADRVKIAGCSKVEDPGGLVPNNHLRLEGFEVRTCRHSRTKVHVNDIPYQIGIPRAIGPRKT